MNILQIFVYLNLHIKSHLILEKIKIKADFLRLGILVLFLLISLVFSVFSQENYHFEMAPIAAEKVGINAKLSQGRVSDIVEDERGLIWIGTLDGLNRYDGYKIKIFRHQFHDSTTIDNNEIIKIINDTDGCLWVLTKTGINKFNPYTEISRLIKFPKEYPNNYKINDIVLDKTNNLWIARTDGLYVLKNKSSFIQRIDLDDIFTNAMQLEADYLNNIWIGCERDYLVKYNYRLKEIKTFLYPQLPGYTKDYQVIDIHQDKELNIWVSIYNKGLITPKFPNIYVIKKGSNELQLFDDYLPIISNSGYPSLLFNARKFASRKGELFISSMSNGLIRINHKEKRLTFMPEYAEQSWATEIDKTALFFDWNGDLWLGGNGEGVSILPSKDDLFNIVNQYIQKDFKIKSVRCFFEYGDNIYIGGYSGLVKMNKKTKIIKALDINSVIYSMESFPGDSSYILLGSEGAGLIKFDPVNESFELLTRQWTGIDGYDVPWAWMFDYYLDGDSLLWCGAKNGILKYNASNGEVDLYSNDENKGFRFGQIFSIYRDFRGELFAGGDGEGLFVFNEKDQQFEKYLNLQFPDFDFQSYRYNQITQTADSIYWFSTDKGLIRMKDDEIKVFSAKDGLFNDFVYAVIPDDNNKLWMSTNDGIFCYDRSTEKMTSFSVVDRLQAQEFNTGAYYKSSDGIIYFGGVNGFNYFDPDQMQEDKNNFPIQIIGFYFNNEEQKLPKETLLKRIYEIPANVDYFKLEFSALSYHANQQFRYKYKIKELNDQWINLSHQNELAFHNLEPGEYTLDILAADEHGNWSTEALSLKLIVKAHFWETSIFKYGILFMLVLFIIAILIYRNVLLKQQKIEIEETVKHRTHELSIVNKELRKANETKDKFFKIISHDIKNPLSAAQSVSGDLIENIETYSKEDKSLLLGILNRSMEHLQILLEDLGSWSQLQNKEIKAVFENCDLKKIVQSNMDLFSASLLKKNIDLNEKIEKGISIEADCKMIDAIIRNLISNAIKFSYTNSVINISAQRKLDYVEIQIEDIGVGMTDEQVNNLFKSGLAQSLPGTENEKGTGFGLLMVYEFVKLNKGEISVISQPKKGSRFILTFSAKNKKAVS